MKGFFFSRHDRFNNGSGQHAPRIDVGTGKSKAKGFNLVESKKRRRIRRKRLRHVRGLGLVDDDDKHLLFLQEANTDLFLHQTIQQELFSTPRENQSARAANRDSIMPDGWAVSCGECWLQ